MRGSAAGVGVEPHGVRIVAPHTRAAGPRPTGGSALVRRRQSKLLPGSFTEVSSREPHL